MLFVNILFPKYNKINLTNVTETILFTQFRTKVVSVLYYQNKT